jgi:glycosyltransferase involved in cell wall biosynthesis
MEKLLVEFARHADRDRFDLRFICLGERGSVADEIEACGWPVVCLGCPPGLRPRITYRLSREFARGRADVVHTHNNNPLIYGGPAARLAGVPAVIQTRHGQAIGTSRRHRALFRFACMFANRVVCVSADSMWLSAAEGVANRRLVVIRNGIDTSRFAYLGPSPGGPVVVVGRLVPAKGVDTLLRATARVIRTRPDFRLEIAGDGEARPGLEQLAGELGLGDRVRFLGTVRDVPELLARASALALPSLSEGISLTLLEAMARGLPIVATRVGGNPEVVEDGVSGRLVPAGDPDRLAEELLGVWPVSDQTRAMGRAGRERVERLFDVRRMVAEYETLYLRLTQRAPVERLAAAGTAC